MVGSQFDILDGRHLDGEEFLAALALHRLVLEVLPALPRQLPWTDRAACPIVDLRNKIK